MKQSTLWIIGIILALLGYNFITPVTPRTITTTGECLTTAPREKYEHLMSHTNELDEILATGAARAREIANKTIERVIRAMLG